MGKGTWRLGVGGQSLSLLRRVYSMGERTKGTHVLMLMKEAEGPERGT